jgi:hypothetical protein
MDITMTQSDTSWRFSPASADDGLDTQVSPSNAPPDLQQAFDDWMANTQGQGQAPAGRRAGGPALPCREWRRDCGLSALRPGRSGGCAG